MHYCETHKCHINDWISSIFHHFLHCTLLLSDILFSSFLDDFQTRMNQCASAEARKAMKSRSCCSWKKWYFCINVETFKDFCSFFWSDAYQAIKYEHSGPRNLIMELLSRTAGSLNIAHTQNACTRVLCAKDLVFKKGYISIKKSLKKSRNFHRFFAPKKGLFNGPFFHKTTFLSIEMPTIFCAAQSWCAIPISISKGKVFWLWS